MVRDLVATLPDLQLLEALAEEAKTWAPEQLLDKPSDKKLINVVTEA